MLNDDKHNSAQRHDPEQVVAKRRTSLNIGCPVARIDKPNRNKKSRTKKAEKRFERKLLLVWLLHQ
jgi:hypothetical protein